MTSKQQYGSEKIDKYEDQSDRDVYFKQKSTFQLQRDMWVDMNTVQDEKLRGKLSMHIYKYFDKYLDTKAQGSIYSSKVEYMVNDADLILKKIESNQFSYSYLLEFLVKNKEERLAVERNDKLYKQYMDLVEEAMDRQRFFTDDARALSQVALLNIKDTQFIQKLVDQIEKGSQNADWFIQCRPKYQYKYIGLIIHNLSRLKHLGNYKSQIQHQVKEIIKSLGAQLKLINFEEQSDQVLVTSNLCTGLKNLDFTNTNFHEFIEQRFYDILDKHIDVDGQQKTFASGIIWYFAYFCNPDNKLMNKQDYIMSDKLSGKLRAKFMSYFRDIGTPDVCQQFGLLCKLQIINVTELDSVLNYLLNERLHQFNIREFTMLFEGIYMSKIKQYDSIINKILERNRDKIVEQYNLECNKPGNKVEFKQNFAFSLYYMSKMNFLSCDFYDQQAARLVQKTYFDEFMAMNYIQIAVVFSSFVSQNYSSPKIREFIQMLCPIQLSNHIMMYSRGQFIQFFYHLQLLSINNPPQIVLDMMKPQSIVAQRFGFNVIGGYSQNNSIDRTQSMWSLIVMKIQYPEMFKYVKELYPENFTPYLNQCIREVECQQFEYHMDKFYSRYVIDFIKNEYHGHNVQFEVPSGFFPYDVYFPDYDLVVNVDGRIHYHQGTQIPTMKHVQKELIIKALNINYVSIDWIRYQNNDYQTSKVTNSIDQTNAISNEDAFNSLDEPIYKNLIKKTIDEAIEKSKSKPRVEAKNIFIRLLKEE
eukprot:403333673